MSTRNFLHVFCAIVALILSGVLEGNAILNGKKANPGEVKYIVTLWNETKHLCGGSILDDYHVLTVAHCVIVAENEFHTSGITLVAGTTNFKRNESTTFATSVEKFYVSDRYSFSDWFKDGSGPYDDIAVLKVRDSFNLKENPNLAAIELPEKYTHTDAYVNKTVQIAGFGYQFIDSSIENSTVKESGNTTGDLYKASMFVMQKLTCIIQAKKYSSLKSTEDPLNTSHANLYIRKLMELAPELNITVNSQYIKDYQLCTVMTEHDRKSDISQGICTGDSGSPLMDGNTAIGVGSYNGVGCDDQTLPNIFTMVSPYLDFIGNAINGNVVEGMRESPILPSGYIPVPKK